MVRAQQRYWGKGAVKAKSHMFADMLFIVMQGGLTTAELTMSSSARRTWSASTARRSRTR
jgi:uncharacterized protein YbcI